MHNFIWNRYYLANIDLNSNFVWRTWRSHVADNVRWNDNRLMIFATMTKLVFHAFRFDTNARREEGTRSPTERISPMTHFFPQGEKHSLLDLPSFTITLSHRSRRSGTYRVSRLINPTAVLKSVRKLVHSRASACTTSQRIMLDALLRDFH